MFQPLPQLLVEIQPFVDVLDLLVFRPQEHGGYDVAMIGPMCVGILRQFRVYPWVAQPFHVSRFAPGGRLGIHRDYPRSAAIQIPLRGDFQHSPTRFHDADGKVIAESYYTAPVPVLMDALVPHSIVNDSPEPRYMLCMSFHLPATYSGLLELHRRGDLLSPVPTG